MSRASPVERFKKENAARVADGQRAVRADRQRTGEDRRDDDAGGDGGRRPRVQRAGQGVRGPGQRSRVRQPVAADRRAGLRVETEAVRQLPDDDQPGDRFADRLRSFPSTCSAGRAPFRKHMSLHAVHGSHGSHRTRQHRHVGFSSPSRNVRFYRPDKLHVAYDRMEIK